VADLAGEQDSPYRAIVVHSDTIGCLVRGFNNGRLAVSPVGNFSARFAEGACVLILTDDTLQSYTGTILPLKASGHRWGPDVDSQPVGWDHVEVRIDERCTPRPKPRRWGYDWETSSPSTRCRRSPRPAT
jgi:putative aminopeptidase FrvX